MEPFDLIITGNEPSEEDLHDTMYFIDILDRNNNYHFTFNDPDQLLDVINELKLLGIKMK